MKRVFVSNKWPYRIVIFLRFLFAPLLFFVPVISIVFSIILDIYDAESASFAGFSRERYEILDKILDFWWYTTILFYSYTHIPYSFPLLVTLYAYRLVGLIIFVLTKAERYLVIFPNFLTRIFYLFFFAELFELTFLTKGWYLLILIFLIIITKVGQEYLLHIKRFSVREQILKWPRSVVWERGRT